MYDKMCHNIITYLFQIVFAICFSGCYYGYFIHEITVHRHDENFPFKSFRDFFPRKMDGKVRINLKPEGTEFVTRKKTVNLNCALI